MQTLDTIHLNLSLSQSLNSSLNLEDDHTWTSLDRKQRGVKKQKWQLDESKFVLGVSRITIQPSKDLLGIEVSAKALRKDYLDGWNKNNIERLETVIQNHGILDLHKGWIYNANVFKFDATKSYKVEDPKSFISGLQLATLGNTFWNTKMYGKENGRETAEFNSNNGNERMQVYNKEIQMNQKANQIFFKEANVSADFFADTIRAEVNYKNFKIIYDDFEIPKSNSGVISLQDILNSNSNAMLSQFERVAKNVLTNPSLRFLKDKSPSIADARDRYFLAGVSEMFNDDIKSIIIYLKNQGQGNIDAWKKKFQKFILEKKSDGSFEGLSSIYQLRELLRN